MNNSSLGASPLPGRYDNLSDAEFEQLVESTVLPALWEWCFIPFFAFLFLIGLVGNMLVCYVVIRNPPMRTVTNIFLVNLACADFFVILLVLPFTVLWDVTSTWFFGTAFCKVVVYIQTVSVCVSVLTLTSISVERWYAICHPLAFKTTLTRTLVIVAIIWCLSLLIALPEAIILEVTPFPFTTFKTNTNYSSVYLTSCTDTWGPGNQRIYQTTQLIILYVIPLCLMAVMYGQIAHNLWFKSIPSDGPVVRMGKRNLIPSVKDMPRSKRTSNDASKAKEILNRRKAAKMLIAVVVLFAICFLPVHVFNLLRYYGYMSDSENFVVGPLILLSRLFCYFNSCVNPVIYNFMSEKFQKEFRRAMVCIPYNPQNMYELVQQTRVTQCSEATKNPRLSCSAAI